MASDTENQTESAEAETGSKKKTLPLLLLAVVGGLAVGGGTGAVVLGPMAADMLGFAAEAAPAGAADGQGDEDHDEGDGEDDGADGGATEAPVVHTLDNLVLNPAGTGGARFLLLTVTFEASGDEAAASLGARDAELRDVVLTTLGRKDVDALVDVTRRDAIKDELVAAVNERFGEKTVVRLYFPQYVVQ